MIMTMVLGVMLVVFTACGGSSGGTSDVNDVNDTEEVVNIPELLAGSDANLSVSEGSSNSYDVSQYINNADSFCFIDIDDSIDTVVSEDCKSFTSSGLSISLVDGNLTLTGNVDITTFFNFGIRGSDDSNNSVDMNVTLEVVDGVDDQAIELIGEVSASSSVIVGTVATLSLSVTDSDGMESVVVNVSNGDSYDFYPDDNLSLIDVNASFPDLVAGDYNISYIAQGVVGGEGSRSTLEASYILTLEALDNTPDAFNITDKSNLALNSNYTSSEIVVSGINTEVDVSTDGSYLVVSG